MSAIYANEHFDNQNQVGFERYVQGLPAKPMNKVSSADRVEQPNFVQADAKSKEGRSDPGTDQDNSTSNQDRSAASEVQKEEEEEYDGVFCDKFICRAFIRKGFLIIMGQVLLDLAGVTLFTFCHPIRIFFTTYWWICAALGVICGVYILILSCITEKRRKSPGNYICFAIFTAAYALFLWTLSAVINIDKRYCPLVGLIMVVVVCVGVVLFTLQAKYELNKTAGAILVLTILVGLTGLSVGLSYAFTKGIEDQKPVFLNLIFQCGSTAFVTAVFCVYLVWMFRSVMYDKDLKIDENEFIFACVQVYLQLFKVVQEFFEKHCRNNNDDS